MLAILEPSFDQRAPLIYHFRGNFQRTDEQRDIRCRNARDERVQLFKPYDGAIAMLMGRTGRQLGRGIGGGCCVEPYFWVLSW